MPVPPAHPVIEIRVTATSASRPSTRNLLARPLGAASIIPNKPIHCTWIQTAYIGAPCAGRTGAVRATGDIVVMNNLEVAGLTPGVTVLGDRLHDAWAGSPLQV